MTAGKPLAASDMAWGSVSESHTFTRLGEGHYRLEIPEASAVFDVDRLQRDRQDLCGEIVVTCHLKGARTFDGNLFSGRINLSDAFRRREVYQRLKSKAQTGTQVDWDHHIDELAARIVRAEREGRPAQLLHTFQRPAPDETFDLEGIVLPRRHPSILFGDGGGFKSYIALYIAGWLGQQGIRVLFADWEFEAEDHRDRLERLFGADMPPVYYQRMHRPMVDEIDSIKRQVDELKIEYIVCDSVGYATDGAPESAEAAMGYFRAVRQLGIGSVHLAHVTKPKEDGAAGKQASDPTKPFGSAFWSNSARSTWFVKRTESIDEQRFVVALFNRKTNLGPLRPAVGLEIEFGHERTAIQRVNLADVDELASSLPIWQRMKRALECGPRTLTDLAADVAKPGEDHDTVIANMEREARRKKFHGKPMFARLTVGQPGGVHRIALASDRSEVA